MEYFGCWAISSVSGLGSNLDRARAFRKHESGLLTFDTEPARAFIEEF